MEFSNAPSAATSPYEISSSSSVFSKSSSSSPRTPASLPNETETSSTTSSTSTLKDVPVWPSSSPVLSSLKVITSVSFSSKLPDLSE